MAQQVLARMIPRSSSGGSLLDAGRPITQENIGDYEADEEVIREASRALSNLGFQIEQADRTGISFAADRARFEEVFGTRLKAHEETMSGTGGREAKRSYFEPTEPIKIPDELASVTEAVVLPRPPTLFP